MPVGNASSPGTSLNDAHGSAQSGRRDRAVGDRWRGRLDGAIGSSWIIRNRFQLPEHPPAGFRELAAAIRDNPHVHGAVVTAHKLRLYRAIESDLTGRDRLAELTHEVNTLAAGDGELRGYARDALSLGRVLPDLPHVLCLGAGGAGTALLLALLEPAAVFADTDLRALHALRAVADRAGLDRERLSFVHVDDPSDGDGLIAKQPEPALVVNATGLGKDTPGSPVSDRAPFRPTTLAWDFNYRGDLTFLRQAAARGARVLDGWDYFVAGWAGALTAIAGTPFTGELLTEFGHVAAAHRPRRERT